MLQCGIVLKSDSIWAPLKITLNKLFGQFINPTRAVPDLASPLGLLPLSNAKLLFQRPFTNGAALWSRPREVFFYPSIFAVPNAEL